MNRPTLEKAHPDDEPENRAVHLARGARNLALVCGGCLAAVLLYAALTGDFLSDGGALMDNPWGLATLVEVYAGLALFAGWVVWREDSPLRSAMWIVPMVFVGNLVACLYVLRAAWDARGDPARFWSKRR